MRISIVWESGRVAAALEETPTARKLLDALPCESQVNTWGDRNIFQCPR